MIKNDNKTIKANDCDLIALTYNDEVVGYTKSDKELDEWLLKNSDDNDHTYDWFCVDADD